MKLTALLEKCLCCATDTTKYYILLTTERGGFEVNSTLYKMQMWNFKPLNTPVFVVQAGNVKVNILATELKLAPSSLSLPWQAIWAFDLREICGNYLRYLWKWPAIWSGQMSYPVQHNAPSDYWVIWLYQIEVYLDRGHMRRKLYITKLVNLDLSITWREIFWVWSGRDTRTWINWKGTKFMP